MKELKVRITFLEAVLGTAPSSEDIYREFIASKSPDAGSVEDEVAAVGVESVVERGTTIFPRTAEGVPFIYDYQIKGFFKDACGMLSRLTEKAEGGKKKKAVNESGKLTAYKKVIDGLIFVAPREIPITGAALSICQRPLRANSPQGERVALASSEAIAAGAQAEFTITCLSDEHEAAVREWLDYGVLRGLGQWRNSGKGRYAWEEIS